MTLYEIMFRNRALFGSRIDLLLRKDYIDKLSMSQLPNAGKTGAGSAISTLHFLLQ